MADSDDKKPLLDDDDDNAEFSTPRLQVKNLYESNQVFGRYSPYRNCGDGAINLSASTSVQSFSQPTDQIVAIFVICFDTKAGNVIEWSEPEDFDLDGVEFKAMPSGSHTLTKDFVYFRKDSQYGLACFENMPVESEVERGARMKSVGILATSYTLLYRHMQFLENQVRHLLHFNESIACKESDLERHQLEIPGKYAQLSAFYADKKGLLSATTNGLKVSPSSTPNSELLPELKITHPVGCFSQFMAYFGEQMFILWKFCLLQKRILFVSPPPIGGVCYRVYCLCCMGQFDMQEEMSPHKIKPHFYINVADIDALESEMAYIACTTEKIFETKEQLYDVYVDNQTINSHIPVLRDLKKISPADQEKFTNLNNQRASLLYEADLRGEQIDDEEIFTSFFLEQNNRLFQTLLDVSHSEDKQLTSDHMKSMGLDPKGDRAFLMELVETYGVDVMLMVDNPCCPR